MAQLVSADGLYPKGWGFKSLQEDKIWKHSSVGSEHLPYKQRVGGPNPSVSTKYSDVAQLVEQLPKIIKYFIKSGRMKIPERVCKGSLSSQRFESFCHYKCPDGVIGNTSFLHDENAKYNPGSSPGRGTIKVLNCIRGFLNVQYGIYNIVKGITKIVIYFPRHCKVSAMISEGSE